MEFSLMQLPSAPSDPAALLPQTVPAAADETAAADATPGVAFNDALLNVIGTLLAAREQTEVAPRVSADVVQKSDDDEDDALPAALPANADAAVPQQLLDALLAAGELTVRPLSLTAGEPAAGESLKMQPLLMGARPAPTAEMPLNDPAFRTPAAAAMPAAEGAQPLPKEMQPVAPLTVATLTAALNTAAVPAETLQPAGGTADAAAANAPRQTATLRLDTQDARWTQQLQGALGERLQLQVKDQVQHATIRLDPPEMGKIDISLHIENGRIQVSINASQGEVYRALTQISNELRQSLTEQNFLQVNVQVSSHHGQQNGRGQTFREQQDAIAAGADIAAEESTFSVNEDDSVLMTV